MDDETDDALRALVQDPDDLDGHTIDDLADYLDSGRSPVDPSIESSPTCRHALAALERLRRLATETLLSGGDGDEEEVDDAWIARVMGRIALDAHAGADFTVTGGRPGAALVMTEGALRALVRATGDDQPEFLVGRVRLDGDLSTPAGPVVVTVHVTVLHGTEIPAAADRLRERVAAALARHTDLRAPRIDIVVDDLDIDHLDGTG